MGRRGRPGREVRRPCTSSCSRTGAGAPARSRSGRGFWVDGEPVDAHRARSRARRPPRPTRTASGLASRCTTPAPGSPAAAGSGSRASTTPSSSRRSGATTCALEGVVVELLDGVDNLADALARLRPRARPPRRRARRPPRPRVQGEPDRRRGRPRHARRARCSCSVTRTSTCGRPCGPSGSGSTAWPIIERGTEWKHGILRELGWPADEQADVARAWQRILRSVRSYADLEPSLLGRVEELIDFVTG